MEIRRITPADAGRLRTVRLAALADSPEAFESTYEDSVGRSADEWSERARRDAAGCRETTFLALEADEPMGMVGAFTPSDPTLRHLYGLWVEPRWRGRGVARSLVDAIEEWAWTCDARSIDLWVVVTNEPAVALYRGRGFRPTGRVKPLRTRPQLTEAHYRLDR